MSAGVIICESQPRGLPAAAIRIGRMLELWGRRAARPVDRRHDALRARIRAEAVAEHQAAGDRARMLRVF